MLEISCHVNPINSSSVIFPSNTTGYECLAHISSKIKKGLFHVQLSNIRQPGMIPGGSLAAQFSFQEDMAQVKSSFHLRYGHRVFK